VERVLVVQHEDPCPPGLVGRWLVEDGLEVDVRRPYAGEPLPQGPGALDGHAGLLVLGGAMGADDDAEHPWLTTTKALLRAAVAEGLPTLGICLGHQLIASALGGRVERNPAGRQRGLVAVGWQPAAGTDALTAGLARAALAPHWNQDVVVDLPSGAVPLALSPGGELQVVRYAAGCWGLQCHPEADASIVAGWPGTGAVVPEVRAAEAALERDWRPVSTAWARLVLGGRLGGAA